RDGGRPMSGLRDLRKPGDPGEPQEADGLGGAYASRTADDGAGGPRDAGGPGRTGGPGGAGCPGARLGLRVAPSATAGAPRAGGPEAHGITDRTAARFRHRDVFSLAEELFARVPRDGDTARPDTTAPLKARADWIVLTLLPGALCLASVLALRHTHGQTRLLTA